MKTRIVEVDGPLGPQSSKLYAGGHYAGHRPQPVGVSVGKKDSKTRYLVEKGSQGDAVLVSLASPKLARPYTGARWLVE